MVLEHSPLVSIVMPTYNRGQYITDTIKSIQAQTYTNWELLIIDDGSDDDTRDIVASIPDSRIHYYNDGRIGITGKIKNKGMQLASGPFIAFMDSDDLWLPHKLATQVKLLEDHPDIHFSFTNSRDFTEDGKQLAALNAETEGISIGNVFLSCMLHTIKTPLPTFVFRKDCLKVCGMFRETRIFNDYRFIGDITYHFDAVNVHEPLLLRRLHDTNSINIHSDTLAEEYIEAIQAFKKEQKMATSVANKILFTAHANYGNILLGRKQWQEALKQYAEAWSVQPLSIIPLKKIMKTAARYTKSILTNNT